MKQEFIPYEQALALKELGFDEPCAACYGSYTHKTSELFLNINNPVNIETLVREKTGFNRPTFYVKTPTYQQAFRWFREKYDIVSFVKREYKDAVKIGFYFGIDTLEHFKFIDFYSKPYKTYEEAELECLKKLIEIVKKQKL